MSKIIIRQHLLTERKKLFPFQKKVYSKIICTQVQNLNAFQNARHVGLYYNTSDEVDIKNLIRSEPTKDYYLPRLQADFKLKFYRYNKSSPLHKNKWGIIEPYPEEASLIEIKQLDIIFFPLVGFDQYGNRLGMGKGCYDKSISSSTRAIRVGVAFSCQEYDFIPAEAHDIKLNYVITENKVYYFPENT
jgi:5-formyltetrahydrofolate cyclo-ligase